MVVFTCQHCNAALKKPVVEKHYSTVCRRKPYLTCVDCLVDFRGDEYTSHTSCVSEDQRYGDKNFVPKPVAVKQNNWLDIVQSCIKKNENPKFKPVFQSLLNYPNVPRKKPKFINFLKNGLKIKDESFASEIFDVFQHEFMKNKENKSADENKSNNLNESLNNSNDAEVMESKKNKKKEKKRNHISESSDVPTKEEEHMNGISESSSDKKKKSKKQKAVAGENDSLEELNNGSPDGLDVSGTLNDEKKKKKKNKSTEEKENSKESHVEQETDTSNLDAHDSNVLPDLQEKLSKKELKKLKKKQKYEAELKEIEENKIVLSDNENKDPEAQEESVEKGKSKKHKKRKATVSESEQDNVKKPKVQEDLEKNSAEDIPETSFEEPSSKAKFNWEDVIKEVLRKSSDQELSIKRLSKKVLAEYQAVKGDRETFEQLMSKFNKKVNKISGVRILKDKAKLISDE